MLHGFQRTMANLDGINKHSSKLKKAQKKANTQEVDLKKTNEKLASTEGALVDECKSNAEAMALSLIEVTIAHDTIDKALV